MKLIVEGMTCGHCIRSITGSLLKLDPVAKVDINLGAKEVAIAGSIDVSSVVKAIQDEGYHVAAILDEGTELPRVETAAPSTCCGSCKG